MEDLRKQVAIIALKKQSFNRKSGLSELKLGTLTTVNTVERYSPEEKYKTG